MNGLLILLVSQCFMYIQGIPMVGDQSNQPNSDFEDCAFNLCNNSTGYNEHKLRSIISRYKGYDSLFGNILSKPMEFSTKNWGMEYNNMCSTKSMTMYPRKGLNVDGHWKKIVNTEGHYQMVNFEVCDDTAECYARKEYLPNGVISSCQTQYIEIRLVVLHENDTLGLERFRIPAGCSCMYAESEY